MRRPCLTASRRRAENTVRGGIRMRTVIPRLCTLVFLTTLIGQSGCGSRERIEKGVSFAKDPNPAYRLSAVALLEGSKEDVAIRSLRTLASDDDQDVRGRAILALGVSKDRGSVTLLIDALEDDREWRHCERHLFAFGSKREKLCKTAHEALKRITGHNVSFDPAWLPEERATAIEKWRVITSRSTRVSTK